MIKHDYPPDFSTLHPQTRLIHTELPYALREQSSALYLSSGYRFTSFEQGQRLFANDEEGFVYARWDNPNAQELVQRICIMEQCEDGMATASGMAAVHAIMETFLKPGSHIVTSHALFGTSQQLFTTFLQRMNISCTQVPITAAPEEWESAIRPETKCIFVETPSNPGLELVDMSAVSDLAKQADIVFIVDNSLATPVLQNPILFGADIVLHSTTKFIDGQGRTLGGVLLGKKEYIEPVRAHLRMTGAALSPFNAWILSKSMETLTLRMERHSANAQTLAEFLDRHDDVQNLRYPFLSSFPQYELARRQMHGGSALLCFDIKGGGARAAALMTKKTFFRTMANFGDVRTILTHPATTTHARLTPAERAQMHISDATIRVSVGIEHIDDIIAEFSRLLELD